MGRGISPTHIQKFLAGIHYPASKTDLEARAKQNNAPSEIIAEIEKLPGHQYNGPQEVMKAYGTVL